MMESQEEKYVSDFQSKLQARIKARIFYDQRFLKQTPTPNNFSINASPDEFFKEISHNINLEDLYKLKEICLISKNHHVCPVVLEIKNEIIKSIYKCNFLLQLWNKYQEKIYELKMQSPLSLWGNSTNYFFYQPGEKDQGQNSIYIMNIFQPKTILRIENIAKGSEQCADHNILTLATENEIRVFKINIGHFNEGQETIINGKELHQRIINTKLKLLGIFKDYYAFETVDNQVDFNALIINNIDNAKKFTYNFIQYAEIIPRQQLNKDFYDPIIKIVFQQSHQFFYTVVLKKSGRFDLYWDNQRKFSSSNEYAIDVDMSQTTFYFKCLNQEKKECYFRINHCESRVLNWDMAEEITDENFKYDQICNQNAKQYMRIYKDLQIISKQNTYSIVTHQSFMSLYDMIQLNWARHYRFEEGEIFTIFQIKDKKDKLMICVILQTGSIYFFKPHLIAKEKGSCIVVSSNDKFSKVNGVILNISVDIQHQKFAMITYKDTEDDLVKSKLIMKKGVIDADIQDLDITSNIVIFQGTSKNEMLFLHQTSSFMVFYKIVKVKVLSVLKTDPDLEQITEESDILKQKITKTYQKESKELDFEGNECLNKEEEDGEQAMKIQFNIIVPFIDYREKSGVRDSERMIIHSIIMYKNERGQNKYAMMFDETNLYIFKLSDGKFTRKEDQYCQSIKFFSQDINYAICRDPTGKQEKCGLFYYNLDEIIVNIDNERKNLPFQLFEVGCNVDIAYNETEARIGYFNTVSHITIVPALHTNMIKFIGINKPKKYLAYRVIKDKFIALHKNGKLQTWYLITGKYIGEHQLKEPWLNNYINHDPEGDDLEMNINKNNKVLLKSIQEQPDCRVEDYFEPFQLLTNLDNQKTYVQHLEKKIVHWKYIQIYNESEIQELLNFNHPTYNYQYLYINNDVKNQPLMIERLLLSKVYLYQGIKQADKSVKFQLKWKIEDYDRELESPYPMHIPFYSPDFSYHINLNRKDQQFEIKETLTNKLYKVIPKDLMTFIMGDKEFGPLNAINRMYWIDNNNIRIVNREGIEKIIDFQDNFKELHSNVIPQFSQMNFEELLKFPYYYERSSLEMHDTETWLLRKYQIYKSSYYLLGRRECSQFYEDLFTVERSNMQYNNLSFTFLHWNIIDSICKEKIQLTDINDNQIQALLYNILPGGNTILHCLAANDQDDDIYTLFANLSQPDSQNLEDIKYHVPILQNFEGLSPLHISKFQLDYKSIDTMLKYLKGYPIDHHSKAIKNLIPHFLSKGLPSLPDYLKSRMLQTEQIKKISKAQLKPGYPAIFPFELWYEKSNLDQSIIDKSKMERRIKCEYIDIPELYHYEDETFQEFFQELAENDNFDNFDINTIQKLIDFNFPLVKKYTVRRLLYPWIIFQLLFFTYYNLFFEDYYQMKKMVLKGDQSVIESTLYYHYWIANMIYVILLLIFATYFILNEAIQFYLCGLSYFSDLWNYIDMIPPVGVYTIIGLSFISYPNEERDRSLQSITTFFMWVKLLYFFRIFKNTGYMIRMLITVIGDMKSFFLVLLIVIIAFSDSMLSISHGNQGDAQFSKSFLHSIIYTYSIILGAIDLNDFDNSMAYALIMCLFVLCTIFNMIIMLNLLIAFISESFRNVNNNAKNAMYQEMASLISENSYLIPKSEKKSYALEKLHLLVITDLDIIEQGFENPIKTQLDDFAQEMTETIDQQNQMFNNQLEQISLGFAQGIKEIKTAVISNNPNKSASSRTSTPHPVSTNKGNTKQSGNKSGGGWNFGVKINKNNEQMKSRNSIQMLNPQNNSKIKNELQGQIGQKIIDSRRDSMYRTITKPLTKVNSTGSK